MPDERNPTKRDEPGQRREGGGGQGGGGERNPMRKEGDRNRSERNPNDPMRAPDPMRSPGGTSGSYEKESDDDVENVDTEDEDGAPR